MIKERWMVTGIPVGGGGRMIGYYAYIGWTVKRKHYIIPEYASAFYGIEIDYATIEPVRVKAIGNEKWNDAGAKYIGYHCPNCTDYLGHEKNNFCSRCGQALLWEDSQ